MCLFWYDASSTKELMIQVEKLYTIKFTEQQALELYEFLRGVTDDGRLGVDRDLTLVYNELKTLFDTGIR